MNVGSCNHWKPIRLPLVLSKDVVQLVRVNLDLSPEQVEPLRSVLSDEEKIRADRFRFDEPRAKFVGCRATLRRLIASCCQIAPESVQFDYGPHGKPQLSARTGSGFQQIQFSVSHSGQFGLIAITNDSLIGVDIEQINPAVKHLRLAERFFSTVESQTLARLPADQQLQAFYRGWTCKEAYIKATGEGFSFPLNQFVVEFDPAIPAQLMEVSGQQSLAGRWSTHSIDVGDEYAAALIVAHSDCQIDCWDWTDANP